MDDIPPVLDGSKEVKTVGEINWMLDRYEQLNNRYQEAEEFIISLLPWYKRIFARKKIIEFIKKQLDKYDF